jgi:hypothetical protein
MSQRTIRVGDEVRFQLAGRTVLGKVWEDRGPIGWVAGTSTGSPMRWEKATPTRSNFRVTKSS